MEVESSARLIFRNERFWFVVSRGFAGCDSRSLSRSLRSSFVSSSSRTLLSKTRQELKKGGSRFYDGQNQQYQRAVDSC